MTLKGFYFNEADIIGDKIQFESSCTTIALLGNDYLDWPKALFQIIV
jgi:hypothetical protein